jgi:hypothetical protein
VPFHVEIRRSFHRAWAFNLGERELRQAVLEPWWRGQPLELGERTWDPADSRLRVLEGRELAPSELGVGQGWNNAERSATDVTAAVLERPAVAPSVGGAAAARPQSAEVALLAQTAAAQAAVVSAVELLGLRTVEWARVRPRLLLAGASAADSQSPADTAVPPAAIIAIEGAEPTPSCLFDAGLTVGALGPGAVVAAVGGAPVPLELEALGVVRIDPAEPSSFHGLADRLRRAGYAPAGNW